MKKLDELAQLVKKLQTAVANGNMTDELVSSSIDALAKMGYIYKYETFPILADTGSFFDASGESPSNLAEALLWKLGKWKSYKNFCKKFSDEHSQPSNTDVVFFAFGRHLKDKVNPIYDQHAIRALWAICDSFGKSERSKCKQLLMNRDDKWKDSGSGNCAIDCYEIFKSHLETIVEDGSSKEKIDKLLMPLGQAIKKLTNNYSDFVNLCGWNENP